MPGLISAGANDARELVDDPRRLVLIEPLSGPFARLQENFADRQDVTLVQAALGASPGKAEMYVSDYDESSSLLEPALHRKFYVAQFEDRETVRVRTLDGVMGQVKRPAEFDAMILDVQGYELEVLKGATRTLRRLRWIKCEVNIAEMFANCAQMPQIDAFLKPLGFRRTETDLHGLHSLWGDAIYQRP